MKPTIKYDKLTDTLTVGGEAYKPVPEIVECGCNHCVFVGAGHDVCRAPIAGWAGCSGTDTILVRSDALDEYTNNKIRHAAAARLGVDIPTLRFDGEEWK